MTQATVDFAAVGRVSPHTELKDIRVIDMSAKCQTKAVGSLDPEFTRSSSVLSHDAESLEVSCAYRFLGRMAESAPDTTAIEINVTYLLVYSLRMNTPLAEEDICQFASANGTLHSWPFVREFLYGLTSRMGFPPFKLGVMHFVPFTPATPVVEGKTAAKPEEGAVDG